MSRFGERFRMNRKARKCTRNQLLGVFGVFMIVLCLIIYQTNRMNSDDEYLYDTLFDTKNCNHKSCIMTLKEWQNTAIPPKEFIVQASSLNIYDDWNDYPVGYQFQIGKLRDNFKSLFEIQTGNHNELCLIAFSTTTDTHRDDRDNRDIGRKTSRKEILKNLINNGFKESKFSLDKYYFVLGNYKFVMSPEGNGIDCHRHYEALMAGCVIVVEKYHKQIMINKYGDVPMIFTDNYHEITKEYLHEIYPKMLNTKYNFARLFYSNWTDKQKNDIKIRSEYWMSKHYWFIKWYY